MARKILTGCLSLAFVAALSVSAMAQAPGESTSKPRSGFGGPGGRMDPFKDLKLTDDQKAKVKEIMTQARKDAEAATDGEAKMKVMKDAMEKIKTDVLNDEQRKLFTAAEEKRAEEAKARAQYGPMAGMIRDLKLTDEQKTKIKDIMAQAAKDREAAADRDAKRKVMKDAVEKVKTDVLTDEQRTKFAELQAEREKKMKEMRDRGPATKPAE